MKNKKFWIHWWIILLVCSIPVTPTYRFDVIRKYMIWILFSISWPVPPKHDRQHFLKKEKISSSYPGVSKFSTNQKPVFYRCFQIWSWSWAAKQYKRRPSLCFCLVCVCCVRIRTCMSAVSVWCVLYMRSYVFCLCLCFCFYFCCCFLFWFLIFVLFCFVLFCFVLFFLFYSFCSAKRLYWSRSLARYVRVWFLYSCMPACVLTAHVRDNCPRARASMFFYCFLYFILCSFFISLQMSVRVCFSSRACVRMCDVSACYLSKFCMLACACWLHTCARAIVLLFFIFFISVASV